MEDSENKKVHDEKDHSAESADLGVLLRKNIIPLLVIALIAGAYYIGSLRGEVKVLKQKPATAQTATAPVGAGAAAPVAGAQAPTAVTGKVPEVTKRDYVKGNRDAKVKLIEYSDLECPFCKSFHPTIQKVVAENKDVAWVYRHFPLNFHVNAQKEGEAAECAGEFGGNDKFWEYLDKIFEKTTSNGTGFALDKLVPLAGEIGLDEGAFKQCLDSSKYEQYVKDQMASGQTVGVNGTPTTMVMAKDGSTTALSGAVPAEQLKAAIDAALAK